MRFPVLSFVALLAAGAVHAAEPAKSVPAPAAASTSAVQTEPGEPKVEHIVNEDKATRIEELRVRGQTQRIVVKNKLGVKSQYEVLPADGGRDVLPADGNGNRGAAGQAVWSVLSF